MRGKVLDNIILDKKKDSPKIILNYDSGLIEIIGKSYPENTFEFYKKVLDWLREYFSGKSQGKTTINIKLDYINSASSQVLFTILDIVNDGKYNDLEINWYYDSDYEDSYDDYIDIADEFPNLTITPIKY